MKIRWTKRALKNLESTLSYLESEWGLASAQKFSYKILTFLSALQNNAEIGKIVVKDKKIRGLVLTKHNTIFYRIKNTEIIILQVFDNRMNPGKRIG